MKDKFYLILSPINLAVILLLDGGCGYFGYLAVDKLLNELTTLNLTFGAIMAFAILVAVLTTVNMFRNGVKFHSDRVEFTGVDSDNEFLYSDIEKIDSQKDDSVSFRKNFVDRYSHIILYLKDEKVVTITLGLTTKSTLNKIIDELKSRI